MDDTGLEHPAISSGNPEFLSAGGAKSGALQATTANLADDDALLDDPLRRLLAVWSSLSDDDRQTLAIRAESLSRGG